MLKEVYRENSIRETYFCPECHHHLKLKNFNHIELPSIIDIESDEEVGERPVITLEIGITCPQCHKGNMVPLDDKIADVIITLNSKGIKTAACCEGHIDEHAISTYVTSIPYILFGPVDETFKRYVKTFVREFLTRNEFTKLGDCIEVCEEYGGFNRFSIYYRNLGTNDDSNTLQEEKDYLSRAIRFFSDLANLFPEQ